MAKEKLVISGDAASAIRSYDQLEAKNRKLAADLRSARDAAKGLKGEHKATGKEGGAALMGLAARWLSVGAAIGAAKKVLTGYREEQKRAAEGMKSAEEWLGKLAGLAGTPSEMRGLMMKYYQSREQGLGRQEAAEFTFVAKSLDMLKHRELFAGMKGIAQPVPTLTGVARLRAAMGAKETGTVRQVLNKLGVAAAVSPVTIEEFAPAAVGAAKPAAMVGARDEELLAALAHMALAEKSGEVASTQLGSFAMAVSKKGMGGVGLLEAARRIRAKKIPDQKLFEFFGRKEAMKGYKNLIDLMPKIEKLMRDLDRAQRETGTPTDWAASAARAYEGVPQLRLAKELRIAKEQVAVREEVGEGRTELERQIGLERWRLEAHRRGEPGPRRALKGMVYGARAGVGAALGVDFAPPESAEGMPDLSALDPVSGTFARIAQAAHALATACEQPEVQGNVPRRSVPQGE